MKFSLALFPFLAILALTSCDKTASTVPDGAIGDGNVVSGVKIGYVNTDTINNGYLYIKQQSDILNKREAEGSATLQRKADKLKTQFEAFQRRAQGGNLTPKQIESEQQVLGRAQQELAAEEQRLMGELQAEGQRIQTEIEAVLKREVEAVQKEGGYDYILSYGANPAVLAVNPTFDLTQQVLIRMNSGTPVAIDTVAVQ